MSDSKNKFIRYIKRMGAGSMLISIIVHMFIIGGATVWVVSSVQPQRKAQSKGGDNAASAVQHPVKMSNTQPKLDQLNKRLSVDTPNSDVALPDLPTTPDSGPSSSSLSTGPGTSGDTGGLKGPLMPLFGFKEAQAGGTLVGNFYDFKQLAGIRTIDKPKPNPEYTGKIDLPFDPASGAFAIKMVQSYNSSGWSQDNIAKFYRAPTPLYATQIFIPNTQADNAPKAYGVQNEVKSKAWMAVYRAKIIAPKSGVYRFVGACDDILLVKMDGRLVLDGSIANITKFQTDRPKKPFYKISIGALSKLTVGKRMQINAGQPYDISIVISEAPGGVFGAFLFLEEEGVDYPKNSNGDPILPIFRVSDAKTNLEGVSSGSYPKFLEDGPVWRALPPSR